MELMCINYKTTVYLTEKKCVCWLNFTQVRIIILSSDEYKYILNKM